MKRKIIDYFIICLVVILTIGLVYLATGLLDRWAEHIASKGVAPREESELRSLFEQWAEHIASKGVAPSKIDVAPAFRDKGIKRVEIVHDRCEPTQWISEEVGYEDEIWQVLYLDLDTKKTGKIFVQIVED